MAKKTLLIDDLDGNEAEETVHFAVDGTSYTIDLSRDNAQRLRDLLAPFVAAAQRSDGTRTGQGTRGRPGRRAGGRSSGRRRSSSRSSRSRSSSGPSAAEIREWARSQGMQVSERGRVSAEVRRAYESAH